MNKKPKKNEPLHDGKTSGFLTGAQVEYIRSELRETQLVFGKRFHVSQPVIFRMESKPNEEIPGPYDILIRQIAAANDIDIPQIASDSTA